MSPPPMAQALALRLQRSAADPSRPALIDADDPSRTLTQGQLADRVTDLATALPDVRTGRRLVQVPLAAEVDAVVAYLSVLQAGHVALVTDDRAEPITTRYRPDLVLGPRRPRPPTSSATAGPRHLLHPDLAVLLSTSGSTGSPKLVRLSRDNVTSNADAIVSALSLTQDDRAISLLPLHYCFGLSVLHSQLRAGGSLVLSSRSATDPGLGDVLDRQRVSVLPATPHLVDLLDVQGVLQRDLPDLRLVTQAGGALGPDRVAAVAAQGRARGWSLVVMYGQTEATARMAVLPPELVPQHADAVGWPVAGSSFRLDTSVPGGTTGDDPVGELVFSGPGVMLGYAEHPDDLALGRMVAELRTGDLARIGDDGLVRIAGRRADSVKIMGLRIDLGRVERQLAAAGVRACVTAAADQLQVTYEDADGRRAAAVHAEAGRLAGLGPSVVSVRAVEVLPRLSNGKVDRLACAGRHVQLARRTRRRPTADLAGVSALLAPLTGHATLDPDRSFVELGGDSFSHVQASLRLGRLLGELPVDWHHRPLRELPQLARPAPTRARGQQVETSVLLRAAAVIMICGSHVQLFPLAGGAHVLLAVAGFSYARYVASATTSTERWRRTARAALGIAVPSAVVAAAMLTLFRGAHWSNVVLLHWAVRPGTGNIFWFVEALLLTLVAVTAVLSAGGVARAYARDPWRVAFLLTLVLLVPRYLVLALTEGPVRGLPWTVAWLFAAGIAFATAQTAPRRLLTAAVAAAATIGFFPVTERNLVIMTGLCLLALLPALVVPRFLVRPVEVVAAASLHVYLVQFQVFAFFPGPVLKFGAALAAGLLFWWASAGLLRRLQHLVPLVAAERRPPIDHHRREDLLCVDAPS